MQNVQLLNVKLLVHHVTSKLQKVKPLVKSGTSFCMPSSRKVTTDPVIKSCKTSLVSLQTLAGQNDARLIKNCESSVFPYFCIHNCFQNIPWPKTRAHFVPRHAHSPVFFEQPTPLPHIRSAYCTGPMHFKYLPVNLRNSYHRPHYTGSRIFDFRVHL